MKPDDFAGTPSGTLVPTDRSQWAFVPNRLPPPLDLSSLAEPLARTSQLLGELNGIGRTLADPLLLIRPLQAREALTSSSMEGTYTTLDELLLVDAGGPETEALHDTREVVNYRRALANAIESLERLPLSLRTMRDAHRTLLAGVRRHRGSSAQPGEFKVHQNFIGAREIEAARFVPPPPVEAAACLGELEKYIHRENRGGIPDLVDAALIHYQFETIHPFADGNGRVGRMLIPLHLFVRRALREPILYLSSTLEARKDEYIDLMFAVSQRGEWLEWIAFFLEVVADACTSAIATADALLALQRDYRRRATGAGRSSNLLAIIDHLFRSQIVTIPSVASLLGVQYRSAQLNIEALVSVGILSEIPGTSNPKYFMAREIRDVINQSLAR
ncbi:Fic family protein [Starkeya koreensis]|uniref:Fic family protein n=1 Tax=Ancylobacter koreensis TaxID=266121 RepID=A0ABT0DI99_9HYPH|nr:Fic family protein [Ancylobacter koreensis]MCK0206992.1 Fic family protein [Ancylobacter koreensis]